MNNIIKIFIVFLSTMLVNNMVFAQSNSAMYEIKQINYEADADNVAVTVSKNTDVDTDAVLILAVYDEDGSLSGCSSVPCMLKTDEEKKYNISVDNINNNNIKCFVWSNISEQRPQGIAKTADIKGEVSGEEISPTAEPTTAPTIEPTAIPTAKPTAVPTNIPTIEPTAIPTAKPTAVPTNVPTLEPTPTPTVMPTERTPYVPSADVPEYLIPEISTMIDKLSEVKTDESFTFSAMTDFHLFAGSDLAAHNNSEKSARLAVTGLSELKRYSGIDADVLLGDYTWGASDFTVEMCKNDFVLTHEIVSADVSEKPKVWCVGNHDLNYGKKRDRMLEPKELFEYIGSNTVGAVVDKDNPEGCYGYVDIPDKKIRMIYLNTCDVYGEWSITEGKTGPAEWIGHKQLQWIADEALDFSDKKDASQWGIVLLSHHPINYGYTTFQKLIKMLEDYQRRESGKIIYSFENVLYTVTYDFTSDKPAKVLCSINGHNHNFRSDYVSSSEDVEEWLLRITVPNLCANRYNESATSSLTSFAQLYGDFDENGDPVYYLKTPDTADATSFCVITVDKEAMRVYAHCFGAGIDRVYDIKMLDKPI